jgi:hypothetical protein
MARRVVPALLVFIALLCDVAGRHGAANVFLLFAIPAAFLLALECYGDAIEARCRRARPLLAGVAVFLLVLSAALRSPAVVGGVPQLAVSVLVFALCLYGLGAIDALVPRRRPAHTPARARTVETAAEAPRRAA